MQTLQHGFQLNQTIELPDCAGTMYLYEHVQTGAQLIYLKRADENKTFAITFKTIPSDDTGVFHILEHSVLNGSKKYPVREPFVELLKSSMQTFLNAMTAPDKTMYPVSSRNETDFKNLMSVYMDAVFHPAIYTNEKIFEQEGWHYEIRNTEDTPIYKGVVLNEMKGAFSSVDETLIDELNRMLFPDNCYQYVSGGDPEHITDLTYEQFIETHKKFYHPSNARIWLDGDLNLDETFAFLNDEYLSHYQKEEFDFSIPQQEVLPSQVHQVEYEIGEEEETKNRTHVSIAKIVSSYDDVTKNLAWSVLSGVLVANNESKLKKSILDAGLGEDVELDLYPGIAQPWAVMTIRNTNVEQYDELRKVIHNTVTELIEQGINQEDLIATLNQIEFKYHEKHEPAGLMYCDRALNSWLYDGDPSIYFKSGPLFEVLRQKVKEGYFEELLKEFLMDEEHQQTVIAVPSVHSAEARLALEQKKLVEAKESWGEEIQTYIQKNEELDQWQATPDTKEALDTLPQLSLEEVDSKPVEFPYEETKIHGIPTIVVPQEDPNIVYMTMYFNIAGMKEETLSKVGFWSSLFCNLPTKKHSVEDLQQDLKKTLGDISFFMDAFSQKNEPEACYPVIGVSFSFLKQNVHAGLQLVQEILLETKFEADKILPLLKQDNEDFRQELIGSGQGIALRRAMAHHSAEGAFREYVGGYESGVFGKKFEENYEEEIPKFINDCEMFQEILFSKARLTVSVTGDQYQDEIAQVIDALHTIDAHRAKVHYPLLKTGNESLIIPAGISYTAMNGSMNEHGYMYDSPIKVIMHMMTYDWLWSEVRVKGGAYGTGISNRINGMISAYSYRDPDPHNLVKALQHTSQYLEQVIGSEGTIDQMIIGAIAAGEPLMAPASKAKIPANLYFANSTYEMRCEARKKLLAMKKEDLKEYCKVLQDTLDHATLCIVGGKDIVSSCDDLGCTPLEQI